jgi:hypothetical protein
MTENEELIDMTGARIKEIALEKTCLISSRRTHRS